MQAYSPFFQDTKITVSYVGNYWKNLDARGPSIRFGKAHIWNNYYLNGNYLSCSLFTFTWLTARLYQWGPQSTQEWVLKFLSRITSSRTLLNLLCLSYLMLSVMPWREITTLEVPPILLRLVLSPHRHTHTALSRPRASRHLYWPTLVPISRSLSSPFCCLLSTSLMSMLCTYCICLFSEALKQSPAGENLLSITFR